MQRASRIQRLELPSVDLPFRGDINLTNVAVWREDLLVFEQPGVPASTYKVLDFGLREQLMPGTADSDQEWRATGGIEVEIQRVDPDTGEGLAKPTFKGVSGDDGTVIAWSGWQLIPVSPRRPHASREPVDVDELTEPAEGAVCKICGSAHVVYVDAAGNPLCEQHVGESPE